LTGTAAAAPLGDGDGTGAGVTTGVGTWVATDADGAAVEPPPLEQAASARAAMPVRMSLARIWDPFPILVIPIRLGGRLTESTLVGAPERAMSGR
jgi:hypothetical protein